MPSFIAEELLKRSVLARTAVPYGSAGRGLSSSARFLFVIFLEFNLGSHTARELARELARYVLNREDATYAAMSELEYTRAGEGGLG